MKLKDLSKVEIEALSYDDIAYMILKESGKKTKINVLFEKVCKVLCLSEKEFEDKIADFFELLSTDKRFVLLDKGYWDLRDNHSVKKIMIDDEDDEIIVDSDEEIENTDDEIENEEDDIFYEADETDDDVDDELKDLVVLDEEETDGLV